MAFTKYQREQWALAQERSRLDDVPGTLRILRDLVAEIPKSAMLNATFANTLKAVNDIEPAIEHFETAVKRETCPDVGIVLTGVIPYFLESGKAGRRL